MKELYAKDERPPRKLPPADQYTVVCCDIDDLGLKDKSYQGRPQGKQRRIGIVFQLDHPHPDTGKRFEQTEYFWLSLGEKAMLTKFLETWRGKAFTEDERKGGWNLMNLIGACGLGTVTQVSKDGKVYANMNTVVKLRRGCPPSSRSTSCRT